jgi:large repetitive protein
VSGNATIASLAPAASQNCTVTYVVPQSVIDNNGGGDGDIDNTASATGTYGATNVSANNSIAVLITRNPLLNVVKTASPTTPRAAGTVITYTYVVTNSGNVTMTGVLVNDVHNGNGVLVGPGNETLTTDTAPVGDSTDPAINGTWATLAPGDKVTFTATYTVTQHDVDFLQ